jgi:hypothetical protein
MVKQQSELISHQKQRQDMAKVVGFRGPNAHHNNELDDRADAHCGDRYAQRLFNALLVNRINLVLSEIPWIIHKSLFGEAAAKSNLARSGGDDSYLALAYLIS